MPSDYENGAKKTIDISIKAEKKKKSAYFTIKVSNAKTSTEMLRLTA